VFLNGQNGEQEFVELYDGGRGYTPLDCLTLVFYDGDTNRSYKHVNLFGQTTNADGYFVVGSYLEPQAIITWYPANQIRDSLEGIALHRGFFGEYPDGTYVTQTNVIDGVVYGVDLPNSRIYVAPPLLSLINQNQTVIKISSTDFDHLSFGRCINGSGGVRNTFTYQLQIASPAQENNCATQTPVPTTQPLPGSSYNLYLPLLLH
jgi:hypothetical protein